MAWQAWGNEQTAEQYLMLRWSVIPHEGKVPDHVSELTVVLFDISADSVLSPVLLFDEAVFNYHGEELD